MINIDDEKSLYRKEYDKFSVNQRELLLKQITVKYPFFSFVDFEHYQKYGIDLQTAIYNYKGREFVFVPGDEVTLGWESFAEGMDEITRKELEHSLFDFEMEDLDIEKYIKKSCSPVRHTRISPMLVERKLNDIGWKAIPINSEKLIPFQKEIQKFIKQNYTSLTIHKTLRLVKKEARITAEMYEALDYENFILQVESVEGFSVPTEDEWEYLCGGGNRSLFPWGDSFDLEMNLEHFSIDENIPYTLEEPNHFGLSIAYDPYKYEVVKSACMMKGGDGGCNICGGLGMVLGYLPTSTYFRGYNGTTDELEYKVDIGGDYTFYRRVFRLS